MELVTQSLETVNNSSWSRSETKYNKAQSSLSLPGSGMPGIFNVIKTIIKLMCLCAKQIQCLSFKNYTKVSHLVNLRQGIEGRERLCDPSFFIVWGCPTHCRGFPWRFVISWDKRKFLSECLEFTTVVSQHIVSQNFQFTFYKIFIWKILLEELNAILQVMFHTTRLEGDANFIFRITK